MPGQASEIPEVLDEADETFDLMIGDLETQVPELPESVTTCGNHFYCR